jgi:Ribosomal protein L11 methyltransferase (PrmA)
MLGNDAVVHRDEHEIRRRSAQDPFPSVEAWKILMVPSIKKGIKGAALSAFPELALKFFSIRSRRTIEAQVRQVGLDRLAREVSRATGGTVAAGPFAGMRLDYELLPVHASPKFLGTYEQELHRVVERAIQLHPKWVLNIGCAEGFYAIGLAIRLNDAQVFAADADPKALSATVKNAELNGVSARVCPVGIVRPRQLDQYLKTDASLLVMDCEGAEFSLLDPANDPILLRTNIVVEIHGEFGTAQKIMQKFAHTHKIIEINPSVRTVEDILVSPIRGIDMLSAAAEWRGLTSWLFLEVNS